MRQITAILTQFADLLGRDGRYDAIARVAVAAYDPRTDQLRSVAHTGVAIPALDELLCLLQEVPSLAILASGMAPRVIDDLERTTRGPLVQQLLDSGHRSSATFPLWNGDEFVGFFFADATEPGYFAPWRVTKLAEVTALLARHLGSAVPAPA